MDIFYSQHGEDFLLNKIFKDKADGVYVEIGCLDGIEYSNTYYFEKKGWKGICLEAHNDFIPLLKMNRPGASIVHCAVGEEDKDNVTFYANKIGSLSTLDKNEEERWKKDYKEYFTGFEEQTVQMRTLTTVFDELKVSKIDFVSLDIEGYEVQALKGLDFSKYRPGIFVIEFKNESHKKLLEDILFVHDYKFIGIIGCNLFYSINKEDKKTLLRSYGKVPLLLIDQQGKEIHHEVSLTKTPWQTKLKSALKRSIAGKMWRFFKTKKSQYQEKFVVPSYNEKREIINGYKKRFKLDNFVESGTFLGDTIDHFKNDFKKLISIELSEELSRKAIKRFAGLPNIRIIHGDSGLVIKDILNDFSAPCLFWLDGHYSSEFFIGDEFIKTAKGNKETPIIEELTAILKDKKNKHVFLIDDARCFNGRNDYPTIKQLKKFIQGLNPNLRIEVKRDIIRITPL